MARELVIRAWCDLCVPHGDRTEAVESHVITLDGRTRELDLCEGKHAAVIGELVRMMDLGTDPSVGPPAQDGGHKRRGRPGGVITMPGGVKADSASEVARTCPECLAVSPTRSAMLGHLGNMHDLTWTDYLAREDHPSRRRSKGVQPQLDATG